MTSGASLRSLFWVPNFLTLLRIAASPILLFSLAQDSSWYTVGLLLLLAATDFFDGYLARRWGVTSQLGAILDPIADKLMLFSCFLFFIFKGRCPHWFLGLWCTCQLLQCFGWGILRKGAPKSSPVPSPIRLSKWSTTLQFFWLGVLFVFELHLIPPFFSASYQYLAETAAYLGLSVLQVKVLFDYFHLHRDELLPELRGRMFPLPPSSRTL